MMTIKGKPENTNAGEITLSLEDIEEIAHRHEDVGPTLREHLVREDLAVFEEKGTVLPRKRRRSASCPADASQVTPEHRSAVLEAYGGRCAYCAKAGPLTLTMLVSTESGGTPTITNTVPACASCRKAQGKRDALDWLDGQKKLDVNVVFARINAATRRLRTTKTLRRAA